MSLDVSPLRAALPKSEPDRSPPGSRLRLWALSLLAIFALTAFYMIGAGSMLLVEPDEPRCALIVRHMIQSGDYVAPQLLGGPYFDKPPLFFWMLAASVKAFGENEWALRLPPAIIAAVTVVLTGLLAGQLFGRRAAWIAGGAFAVSIVAIVAARVVRMDMLLVVWITAAMLCWARAFLTSPSPATSAVAQSDAGYPRPLLASGSWPLPPAVLMYLCMALGCLTKGPIAIALPGLVIAIYLLLSRPLRDIPRDVLAMRPLLGLFIVLAVYGSWVACMTWRYPQYPAEFFGRQNLDRFAGSGLDASEPPWIIVGTFLGGLTPWIPLVGLAGWLHRPRRSMPAAEKLLWIWGVTVLVVFTISKARMPNYVLPAFPPTFALLGACLAGLPNRLRKPLAINLAGTFLIVAGTLVAAAVALRIRFGEAEYLQAGIALAGVAVLALPAWLLWRRQPILAIVPLMLAAALAGIAVACGPARAYCAARSAKVLADPLATLDPRTVGEVVMATEARYGVIFYAPPSWQFRRVALSRLNSLLPLLNNATRPLYAILTGGGVLWELQHDTIVGIRVSERLTVLQRWGQDALVRIDPPAASSEPARDNAAAATAPGSARRLENFTTPRPHE